MSTTPETLDLANIQGDILSGLPKKTQTYIFFQIADAANFKHDLIPFASVVKTVEQVLKDRDAINEHKKSGREGYVPMSGINIAFSHLGLQQLGIDDSSLATQPSNPNDPFILGQLKDSITNLGDPAVQTNGGTSPDWDPAFLKPIHGVVLISGDCHDSVNKARADVEAVFGERITIVTTLAGDVRPGVQSGHEHFGFLDGISNPSIIGFDDKVANPGPAPVNPGILLTGHKDDPAQQSRAPWAVDGSFLVFRYLFQLVPEFNTFLKNNPLVADGMTPEEGSELLGARIVGRWKSGAPIDITPFKDDPVLASDSKRNNDFHFTGELGSQVRCPFAAHVRKSLPRDDLASPPTPISIDKYRIMRRGVQFGPELTPEEQTSGKTQHGRGLLFACYQTDISSGFQFIQKSWANSSTFPFKQTAQQTPGLDGLIGQGDRVMTGLDPNNTADARTLPTWITPRGGEYFFTPSLKALKETFATA